MGEIVAIVSGKGGTGKTSVCAGVAVALAASGSRVLCIDCDVGLRNLDISLGMSDCDALSFLDVAQADYPISQATRHPNYPTLSFLTAPMTSRGIDTLAFGEMLSGAREAFDFIFLDAPAGVGEGFRLTAAYADRFLLVTGSGPAAVRDAARVGDILELQGKTNVRLVVNRVNRTMLSILRQTIDDVMDEAGLPLIGVVAEDENVPLAAACNLPLLRYSRHSPAAVAFRNISKRIQGLPEPISLR